MKGTREIPTQSGKTRTEEEGGDEKIHGQFWCEEIEKTPPSGLLLNRAPRNEKERLREESEMQKHFKAQLAKQKRALIEDLYIAEGKIKLLEKDKAAIIKKVRASLAGKSEEAAALKKSLSEQEEVCLTLNRENTKLKESLSEKEEEIVALKALILGETKEEAITVLHEEINHLKNSLYKKDNEKTDLGGTLSEKKKEITALRAEISSLQMAMADRIWEYQSKEWTTKEMEMNAAHREMFDESYYEETMQEVPDDSYRKITMMNPEPQEVPDESYHKTTMMNPEHQEVPDESYRNITMLQDELARTKEELRESIRVKESLSERNALLSKHLRRIKEAHDAYTSI